jgi:hypothetical protein
MTLAITVDDGGGVLLNWFSYDARWNGCRYPHLSDCSSFYRAKSELMCQLNGQRSGVCQLGASAVWRVAELPTVIICAAPPSFNRE